MLRFISSSRNSDLLATVASLSAASWLMRNETAIFLSVLGLPDPSRGPPLLLFSIIVHMLLSYYLYFHFPISDHQDARPSGSGFRPSIGQR